MRKRQEGFTLIELLAVIIILAIIALIAIPTITGLINKSRESAAKDSAYGYVDAIEKLAIQNMLNPGNDYDLPTGTWTVGSNGATITSGSNSLNVSFKGDAPEGSSGVVYVSNNTVCCVSLTFNGKTVVGDPTKSLTINSSGNACTACYTSGS